MLAHVKKKEKQLTATLGWLTHTGREVPPSGLNPNSRISTGDLLPGLGAMVLKAEVRKHSGE
jgi:hypothetical protein